MTMPQCQRGSNFPSQSLGPRPRRTYASRRLRGRKWPLMRLIPCSLPKLCRSTVLPLARNDAESACNPLAFNGLQSFGPPNCAEPFSHFGPISVSFGPILVHFSTALPLGSHPSILNSQRLHEASDLSKDLKANQRNSKEFKAKLFSLPAERSLTSQGNKPAHNHSIPFRNSGVV
jgi:hypothetical protein